VPPPLILSLPGTQLANVPGGVNEVPENRSLGTGRPKVNKQIARKPFVVPQLKEEASLASVTLTSGGGHVRGGFCKKGKTNNFGFNRNGGYSNTRRGH